MCTNNNRFPQLGLAGKLITSGLEKQEKENRAAAARVKRPDSIRPDTANSTGRTGRKNNVLVSRNYIPGVDETGKKTLLGS